MRYCSPVVVKDFVPCTKLNIWIIVDEALRTQPPACRRIFFVICHVEQWYKDGAGHGHAGGTILWEVHSQVTLLSSGHHGLAARHREVRARTTRRHDRRRLWPFVHCAAQYYRTSIHLYADMVLNTVYVRR